MTQIKFSLNHTSALCLLDSISREVGEQQHYTGGVCPGCKQALKMIEAAVKRSKPLKAKKP